jgi:alpha-mannosidase
VTAITLAQRLKRLRVLLDELACWRVRTSVDLEGWTCDGEPMGLGEGWPSRQRCAVLAHPQVDVPQEWPREDARLRVDVGDEALLEVRYPDRAALFSLDLNHHELPVWGPSFSLRADAVARHEFGDAVRDPRLTESALVLLEPAVDRLVRRLGLVVEAAAELGDHEVVPHLVRAAEVALNAVRLPSGTAEYLRRTARLPEIHGIWRLPEIARGPLTPLGTEEVASAERAGDELHATLVRLRDAFPKRGALAVTGHAHIDLAWLWPLEETRRKARRTFSTMTSLLEVERNREFRFNQGSAQIYEFLAEDDGALFERVRREVEAGRWVEPDTNMPTGESLTRQALYGQRWFERTFGRRHRVGWMPDCFGFTAALPQVLRGAGMESFFTVKLTWQETNRFPYDLFRWRGLDGSEVLVHMFDDPPSPRGANLAGYNGDVRPVNLRVTWQRFRGKTLSDESLLTVGAGDGGGGPQQEMLDDMAELAAFPVLPELRNTTVDAFFARLHERVDAADVPVWDGELYFELHRGTLTTQGRTKRLHRRAERALLAAEALGAMAAMHGAPTPPSLEPLWRVLLRNQFHDILPGSSIREVYEQAEAELAEVVDGAEARAAEHLGRLAAGLAGGTPGIVVVNPELRPRPLRAILAEPVPGSQPVEEGHLVAGGEDVPGLSLVGRTSAPAPGRLRVDERLLENELVRVELAPDGTLARVLDKRAGRDALAGRGNQLWAYVDKPREWDAWDVDAAYADAGEELTDIESWSRRARAAPRSGSGAGSGAAPSPRTSGSGRTPRASTSAPRSTGTTGAGC